MIPSLNYFRPGMSSRSTANDYILPDREGSDTGTSYSRDIDYEFVLALATLGSVSITSRQVTLRVEGSAQLKDLRLPDNARLEYCGVDCTGSNPGQKGTLRITFKFLPKTPAPAPAATPQ